MVTKNIRYKVSADGVKSAENKFKNLGNTVRTIFAGVVALAVARTGKEIFDLGIKAEGIRNTFKKLDGVSLNELRSAVRGTVNDLTLMQNAVKADKLGIPVEQLATLFEFASIRARETGESVAFLTESIILGLGRKSVMIIDNLGISAVRVREAMRETGDFAAAVAKIVQEDMVGMDKNIAPAADAADRLAVAFDNLQLLFGEKIVPVVIPAIETMTGLLERINSVSDIFVAILASMSFEYEHHEEIWDRLGSKIEKETKKEKEIIEKTLSPLQKLNEEFAKWIIARELANKEAEKEEGFLERYKATFEGINELLPVAITNADRMTANIEETADALGDVKVETKKAAEAISDDWLVAANMLSGAFSFAFRETLVSGENAFESLYQGFKQMLENMVAELAAKAALFGFLNLLSDGGFSGLTGGLTKFLGFGQHGANLEVPKMQSGGSLRVGGRGGADSQLVSLLASPGETVNVTPEGGSPGGLTLIIQGDVYDGDRLANKISNTMDRYLGRNR
jgi:hypothetical protein